MFRPDIQGLRAIAVVPVLIFHAMPNFVTGGYIGVDVFFVISGYLISGILVREIEGENFSIAEFYRRRIRRIFPALLVLLVFCLLAGYWVLIPIQYKEMSRTVLSTMLFASNFDFYKLTDYFGGAADLKPLLHTWSLAVEEQFYIAFPLLLYALYRCFKQGIPLVLGVLFVGSLILSETLLYWSPSAAYYMAPSRVFELLAGAIIAVVAFPRLSESVNNALSLLGLAGILGPILLYTPTTPFPGLAALIPCIGTALVIHAGRDAPSSGGALLSAQQLQFVGNISYSLYLWHWPILAFARNLFGAHLSTTIALSCIMLAFLLASASYRFVEQPFLQKKYSKLPYLRLGMSGMGVIVSLALAIYLTAGLPGRYSASAQAMFASAGDFNQSRDRCHNGDGRPLPFSKNCIYGDERSAPDAAVWGDSHGAELVVALGDRARKRGRSVIQITASACPPTLDFSIPNRPFCRQHNHETLDALAKDPTIKTVVLAANATNYSGSRATLEQSYEAVVRDLNAAGKQVVLVSQIPIMEGDPPVDIGRVVQWGGDPATVGVSRVEFDREASSWRDFLVRLSKIYNAGLFDPTRLICDSSLCHAYDQNVGVLYFNREHLGIKGAAYAFKELGDELYGPVEPTKTAP